MASPLPGFPAIALSGTEPGAGLPDLPWIDSWRWITSRDGADPFWPAHEVRHLSDGIQILSKSPFAGGRLKTLDSEVSTDSATAWGAPLAVDLSPEVVAMDGGFASSESLQVAASHDGGFALLSDGQGPVQLVVPGAEDLRGRTLGLHLSDSCGTGMGTERPDSAASDQSSQPSTVPSDGLRPLRLAKGGTNWFLADWPETGATDPAAPRRPVLIEVADPATAEAPVATVHCPGSAAHPTLLGTDLGTGASAWASTSKRSVAIWSLPSDGKAAEPLIVDLPNGKIAAAVAFPASGKAVLADTDGQLYAVTPGPNDSKPRLEPLSGLVLPGIETLQAQGDLLLLVSRGQTEAGQDGTVADYLTLVTARLDADSGVVTPLHWGSVPVLLDDVVAFRPTPDGKLVELVHLSGMLLRIGLPEVPPPTILLDEVMTLSSPDQLSTDPDGSAGTIKKLLLSAFSQGLASPPLRDAARCSALVEAALSDLATSGAPAPRAADCTDPSARSLTSLIDSLPRKRQAPVFDDRISQLLALGAEGDTFALRALATVLDPGGLIPGGPDDPRLAGLLPQAVLADPAAGMASPDAGVHLRLARTALGDGDAASSFRHAWIAEAAYVGAGLQAEAMRARDLRFGSGTLLSATERLAALAELVLWQPAFAPPPALRPSDLDRDLAALDRIAELTGGTDAVERLKDLRRKEAASGTAPPGP